MPLRSPDFNSGPADARWSDVKVGSALVRIGNAKYPGNGYNPNPVVPNKATNRGRFSSTVRDIFGALYAAEHVTDERVAILEMLEHRTLDHNPNGGLFYCKPELVKDLSFFYLNVKLHMRLVTLTAAPDALGFGANEESIYSDNYRLTREWTRYIRKRVPDAKGIEYSPKRYRDTRAGVAMALFEDRLPKDSLELVGAPIPLVSDAGRDIFLNCSQFTRVMPGW